MRAVCPQRFSVLRPIWTVSMPLPEKPVFSLHILKNKSEKNPQTACEAVWGVPRRHAQIEKFGAAFRILR